MIAQSREIKLKNGATGILRSPEESDAEAMLIHTRKTAEKMGYEQLELGVCEDNERARALYTRLGFEEWGRKKRAYRLKDGTYLDEIVMGKVFDN